MSDNSLARPEILRLDNTKRSAFAECPRKYYWQHVRHLKPKTGSTALRYGVVWHAAMDAFYTHIAEHGWKRDGKALEEAVLTARVEWAEYSKNQTFYDDYRNLPNLMQSIISYMDHFSYDEGMLEIVASEELFEIPMFPQSDDETIITRYPPGSTKFDKEHPFFIFTGMIDLEILLNGQPWVIDHKTTGKQLQQMESQLRRSPQFIGYFYAATQKLQLIPTGFLVVIHHLSAYKSRTTGDYGKPKIDFHRTPEVYTQYDIDQWRLSIFHTAKQVYDCQYTNIWPMQFNSCHTFGTCSFVELCKQQCPLEDVYFDDAFFVGEPWDIVAETKIRQERREAMLRGDITVF